MSIAPFVYAGETGSVIATVAPPPSPPAPSGPSPLDDPPSRGEQTPVFGSQSKPLRSPADRVGHPEDRTTMARQTNDSLNPCIGLLRGEKRHAVLRVLDRRLSRALPMFLLSGN